MLLEERISELRGELILLTKRYSNLEAKYNKLNLILEELQNDRNQIKTDYEQLTKEFDLITLKRNEVEKQAEDVSFYL